MRKTTLFFIALFIVLSVPTLQAQTLTVLYSFKANPDGAAPYAGLLRDKTGSLYGTTSEGGIGWGTVFKVDASGDETLLHTFGSNFPDGGTPQADLIMDKAGNLYGTTEEGGVNGLGTVFKVDASGNETLLHIFTDSPDGAFPVSRLVMDKRGNLYGTTIQGGSSNLGTVFKLDNAGNETVLHSFTGSDGAYPSSLIMDKRGNLYGATGSGGGTVYKLDTAGNETVLHSFTGSDGAGPGGLVMDKRGNLYGITGAGGSSGAGTVFKLDTAGNVTVLHSFNGSDGAGPTGDLAMDEAGNLYGTTVLGGSSGAGTVFKVDSCGNETVLHSFTDVPDGAYPFGSLTIDKSGNLYGTTNNGGTSQNGGTYSYGTVFKLTQSDCDEHQGFGCEERHDSNSDEKRQPDCKERHGREPDPALVN